MPLPKNYEEPYQLVTTLSDTTTWSENDLKTDLPDGFRYVYKNSCDDGPTGHKCSADFYKNKEGGIKIDRIGVGFQTMLFEHTGAKLEIRIGISQVNNNNKKVEKNKDTAHVYFFDKDGTYLNKYVIKEGTISSTTKEIKFTWTEKASEIAYFEYRSVAYPYKSSQCYNYGISYCNIKSWERA